MGSESMARKWGVQMGFAPENEFSLIRSLERIANSLEELNNKMDLLMRKLP